MSIKGKHADGSSGSFYRDLIMMIIGILLVGAVVFLVLYLLADEPDPTATTGEQITTTTTTTSVTSTTSSSTTTTTTPTTTTTVPVRPPEEVHVAVLNSVGIDGAAGRMTAQLDEAGYQTLAPDDYEPEQSPSRLWYREGFSTEANALLAFLPDDALVEPLADDSLAEGADVVMVLGTGYEG